MNGIGTRLLLSCAAAFLYLASNPATANPDAKRLYDDLLSNYNRLIRPVANNTDKITVKMGLKLSQLVDLVSTIVGSSEEDEVSGFFVLSHLWMRG